MKDLREYLKDFMLKLDFPDEARRIFLEADNSLNLNPIYMDEMKDIIDEFYFRSGHENIEHIIDRLTCLSEKANIHVYTMYLLFYIYSSHILLQNYEEAGIPTKIFWDSMADLKYKLWECHDVHGVWGTFVERWFVGFFVMTRFALGRLQYERIPFAYERYERAGNVIKKGDIVYNIHIPSSGPLTLGARMDSYKKAYDFFKDELDRKPMPIVCNSWLLYPDNEKFYKKGSNIIDFMHDFEIIDTRDQEGFPDAWRIFGKHHERPISQWPTDTSLQRSYVKWLKAGNKVGTGYGILLFDGEKIL
ncbi:MAG: DUF5596 domain-containing protein [Clostridiales bacterium]|nr:DUF5596 domain-containing protein [Clostridiales bacterium]